MHLSKQLTQLNQKIIQSKTAFKKNKENFNSINIPSMITSRNDLIQIKQSISTNLSCLTTTKKTSTQVYESVVNHLKLLLEEAYTKNEFLVRDRAQVLKQNQQLKHQLEQVKLQLENARREITEMRLNAGAEVKGLLDSGNIFEVLVVDQALKASQSEGRGSCREVVQHGDYSIREDGQEKSVKRNNNSINQSQRSRYNDVISESRDQNSNYHQSPIQSSDPHRSPSSQQSQSLLIRQQSHQQLHPTPQNILSPSPQSQVSSNQMNTPNYNFRETFEMDNFNRANFRNHYIDVKEGIISYDNSCQGSGNGGRAIEGDYCQDKSEKRNRNNEVEISLNGLMNANLNIRRQHSNQYQHQHYQQIDPKQLYLNINPDRILLKQEIQTFKEHLRGNNEESHNEDDNQNNNNRQQLHNNQQQPSALINSSQYHPPTIVSCLSSCPQGILRAFYMNLLQHPLHRQSLVQILTQLQTDDSFTLYNLYPKNQLWIQLLNGFLNFIQVKKPSYQQLITHFNEHKLVDVLMCQLLKYRVAFLFNENIQDGVDQMLNDGSCGNSCRSNKEGSQNVSCSCEEDNDDDGFDYDSRDNDHHGPDENSPINQGQSINQSIHQNSTLISHSQLIHSIFNALALKFNLSCIMSQTGFQFYQSQTPDNTQPLFTIYLNQQTHTFIFDFVMHYQHSHQCSQQIGNSQQLNRYQNSVHRPFQEINLTPGLNQYHNDSYEQGSNSSQDRKVSPKYRYYADRYNNCQVNNRDKQINTNKYHEDSYYEDNSQQQQYYYENRNFISQTNYNEDQSSQLIQQLRIGQNHNNNPKNNKLNNTYTYQLSQNTSYHFNTTPNSLQNTQHSLFPSNKTSQLQTVAGSFNNLSKDLECRQLRQRNINYNMCFNSPIEEQLLQNYQSKQLLSGKFRDREYDFSGHSSILASDTGSGQVSRVVDDCSREVNAKGNKGYNGKDNSKTKFSYYNTNNYNTNNNYTNSNPKKGRYPLYQQPIQTIYNQNYLSRKIHSIQSDNDDHAIYESQSSNKKYVQHSINRIR